MNRMHCASSLLPPIHILHLTKSKNITNWNHGNKKDGESDARHRPSTIEWCVIRQILHFKSNATHTRTINIANGWSWAIDRRHARSRMAIADSLRTYFSLSPGYFCAVRSSRIQLVACERRRQQISVPRVCVCVCVSGHVLHISPHSGGKIASLSNKLYDNYSRNIKFSLFSNVACRCG